MSNFEYLCFEMFGNMPKSKTQKQTHIIIVGHVQKVLLKSLRLFRTSFDEKYFLPLAARDFYIFSNR